MEEAFDDEELEQFEDDLALPEVHRLALREFVINVGAVAAGRIPLTVRGREIGINGNDNGNLGIVDDDDLRARIARDVLAFVGPTGNNIPPHYYYGNNTLTFTWNVALRQRNVTDQDFEALLEVARSSRRPDVTVELRSVDDECAARRLVRLLAALTDLQELEVTDESHAGAQVNDAPDETATERLHMLLRAFLVQKKSTPTFATNITSLDYMCCRPVSPILLLGFFESIAAALKTVKIGSFDNGNFDLTDEDLARLFAMIFDRLPCLEVLTFFMTVSVHVPVVMESLAAAPQLGNVFLCLQSPGEDHDERDDRNEAMMNVLNSTAELASRSKTLRRLTVISERHENYENQYDISTVLLGAADSSTLEFLTIQAFGMGGSGAIVRREGPRNESVTSVEFTFCDLRAGTFELLSRFKGITSIELSGCVGLERAGQWYTLTSNLPRLLTFIAASNYDRAGVPRDAILNGIARAGHTFRRLRLDLSGHFGPDRDLLYPSLEALMVETGGGVELHLDTNDSDSFILAGVAGAKKLESLRLYHSNMSPQTLAQLFTAVRSNMSLRSFGFRVSANRDRRADSAFAEECGDSLLDLMRFNQRLKVLAFDDILSRALLSSIVEGLRVNRSINVLELTWYHPVFTDATVIDNFANILKVHNTSLKTIKGLGYESDDVRERFERYLWENRSGRHFLRNPDRVTPSLLPCILFAISRDAGADGLRYFLKNASDERLLRLLSSSRGKTRSPTKRLRNEGPHSR